VPAGETYFRRIGHRRPAVVHKPLHVDYFTALRRHQARHYYRAYYYQCARHYYPYDLWYHHFYVHYYHPCYYARPYVVVSFPIFIERYHKVYLDSGCDRGVWYYYDGDHAGCHREHPYLTDYPGTLGKALRDLQWTWYEEDLSYLIPHVDQREPIGVYRGDRHTHDLDPSEFLDLTLDAFDQTETDYLRYTEIRPIWGGDGARADAKHVFWDADGEVRTVYLSYLLERVEDRHQDTWLIREVRQDSQPF
jgi:hypothetical protein